MATKACITQLLIHLIFSSPTSMSVNNAFPQASATATPTGVNSMVELTLPTYKLLVIDGRTYLILPDSLRDYVLQKMFLPQLLPPPIPPPSPKFSYATAPGTPATTRGDDEGGTPSGESPGKSGTLDHVQHDEGGTSISVGWVESTTLPQKHT